MGWRATRLLLILALVVDCGARRATTARPTAQSPGTVQKRLAFSILEDYDKGDDLADVDKDFDLFRQLGVTTWRGSFGWDDYEPSRGAYDFAWLHRFADLAASRGITLRPYIGYTPRWAAAGGADSDDWNDPPRNLDDWYRFVRALASAMRRHRNLVSYEIYNEENVKQWWDGAGCSAAPRRFASATPAPPYCSAAWSSPTPSGCAPFARATRRIRRPPSTSFPFMPTQRRGLRPR
jgi:hypothetical protein